MHTYKQCTQHQYVHTYCIYVHTEPSTGHTHTQISLFCEGIKTDATQEDYKGGVGVF